MRYAADLSVSGWFFATGGVVCFSFDTTLALRAETKTTNLAWEENIYPDFDLNLLGVSCACLMLSCDAPFQQHGFSH
jgi:hypothetical protein